MGTEPTTPTTEPCVEDQPCWDCSTMGNQICGTPEPPVIVQDTPPNIYEDACFDMGQGHGITEWLFLPCDPATWPGPVRTAAGVWTPPTTTVPHSLPETGGVETAFTVAVILTLIGVAMRRFAHR